MLGKFDFGSFETARSIEEQRDILAALQARQYDMLMQTGLAQKAITSAGQGESQLGQVMVARGRSWVGGRGITHLKLAMANYRLCNGSEIKTYSYATVGQQVEGVTSPLTGFSQEEADLVANMAEELQALKDEGILPNLDPSLMTVFDRSTAMTTLWER